MFLLGLWLSVGWKEEEGTSFLISMSPAWQGQICRGLPGGDQAAESVRPSRVCTSRCDEVPCRPVTLLACFSGSPTAPQTRCMTRCSRTSPRASTVRAWSATPSSAPSGKWSVMRGQAQRGQAQRGQTQRGQAQGLKNRRKSPGILVGVRVQRALRGLESASLAGPSGYGQ